MKKTIAITLSALLLIAALLAFPDLSFAKKEKPKVRQVGKHEVLYLGKRRISERFDEISDIHYNKKTKQAAYVAKRHSKKAVFVNHMMVSKWYSNVNIKKFKPEGVFYTAKRNGKKAKFRNTERVSNWK
jgi:hypothetical protein